MSRLIRKRSCPGATALGGSSSLQARFEMLAHLQLIRAAVVHSEIARERCIRMKSREGTKKISSYDSSPIAACLSELRCPNVRGLRLPVVARRIRMCCSASCFESAVICLTCSRMPQGAYWELHSPRVSRTSSRTGPFGSSAGTRRTGATAFRASQARVKFACINSTDACHFVALACPPKVLEVKNLVSSSAQRERVLV